MTVERERQIGRLVSDPQLKWAGEDIRGIWVYAHVYRGLFWRWSWYVYTCVGENRKDFTFRTQEEANLFVDEFMESVKRRMK